ncbi:MAG: hypothetical protein ACI8XB_002048 [Patiriisocius sp.]|jgi:hypothetical protein
MKLSNYILITILIASLGLTAQEVPQTVGPKIVTTVSEMRIVPSLASRSKLIPARILTDAPQDGRSSKNLVVPGKEKEFNDGALLKSTNKLTNKIQSRVPELVFEVNNNVNSPSDPAMGVGPDHAVIVYNTGIIIYDKDGNDLTGAFSPNNIFSSGGCCDLTASYDNAADRWVISYLYVGSGIEVAVSSGPDPVNSDWYVYSIPQVNDYNKLSVWSDGYYITDNNSGTPVWVMERDAMLAGNVDAGIQGFSLPGLITSGFHSTQVLNVSDGNLPAVGGATVMFLQDDAWLGVMEDHVKFWTIDVDWTTPANSTVSPPINFVTEAFVSVFDGGSFSNLVQPGGGQGIDALQSTIMNQAQFRKFPSYNSALFNFVVDVDPSGGKLAATRWYEFRQDGDNMPWSMYQEGTYTAPDGKHAWLASMIMDYQGNIGMGYTSMAGPETPNPTDFRVGAYYTGRYASDPLNTMTLTEEVIGVANSDVGGFRFGDYAKIDLDPINGKEFWFITEYTNTDIVGVFQIASDFANDIGAVAVNPPVTGALTTAEAITVTVFNYGLEDASGFDVNYQVDGGTIITEPFPGTVPSGSSMDYTFTATADLSIEGQVYTINAFTSWATDQFPDNDAVVQEVTHLSAIDSGAITITNPASGSGLSATESVTIEITNFGSATQTSIPVYYNVNGGTSVNETYTGSIAQGETDSYTFVLTADLSELGDYEICTGTELPEDGDETNDDVCSIVSNFICQPVSDCAGFDDGVAEFDFVDQGVSPECSEGGYTDNTDVVFNIILNDNPFEGTVEVGFSNTSVGLWIDFNDNNAFEDDELVLETEQFTDADTEYDFDIDFSDFPNTTTGMHLMRLRGLWQVDVSDLDACEDINYGSTNDYTANITGAVGIEENNFAAADLNINTLSGNQFDLTFNTTDYTNELPVSVMDAVGRTLAFYTLKNNGSGYTKRIDMSYVAAGIYFVRVGNANLNKVKRIVVE